MKYTTTIENKYEEQVEVTVDFEIGEDGVEINTIHDHTGNDVEPYDRWALEQLCDEFYFDLAYEQARKGNYNFHSKSVNS